LNIFIYGNQSFKKDIQKILKNSKINKVLDDLKIVEINELQVLKENIASNPNDIYLIDDDSIIRKKSKFKFFKPKDGIEEEFLLECGVDDLSIDSLDDLPNYIIRKHNRQNLQNNKVEEIDVKPLEQNSSIDLKEVANVNSEQSNENQTEKAKEEDNQNIEDKTNTKPIETEENSENNENQDDLEETTENVEDIGLGQDDIDNILEEKEELEESNDENKEDKKDDEIDNLDNEIQDNTNEVKLSSVDENDIIDEEKQNSEDNQDMKEEKQDNDFSSLENFSEDVGLNNVSYDYDDNTILNDNAKNDDELLADILSSSTLNEDYLNSVTETFEDVNFVDEALAKDNNANNDEKLKEAKESIAVDDKPNNENQVFFEENDKSQEIKTEDSQSNENEINIEEPIEKGWAEESLKESVNQDNNTKFIEDKDIDLMDDLEDFTDEKREIILKSNDNNDEAKNIQSLVTNSHKEESVKNIDKFEENIQGDDNMSDEFFELDSLSEQDLIAALTDGQSDFIETKNETKIEPKSAETIAIDGSKKEDIADLISQLLNNKTLEITIKAKD